MALEGKNVLITGAARRIGRSLALAVARAGGNVVVHYGQSEQDAQRLQSEIENLGQKACLLSADLADPEQVTALVARALEFGPLYALVNNASVFTPLTWDNTLLADWNRTMQINLTAPFLLSQAFAHSLPPDAHGRIVNLLDWRALRPGPDHFPYTISKAALAALTRSLAAALAPRVTVNGLALGAILKPTDGAASEGILDQVPAGRWASLDEVDRALLFLLDGPEYITGEIIHVDGGRHLL
jgi:NAD(P)-dependent dehydrogenase (short-subunit alcohol dehydrogenase family)